MTIRKEWFEHCKESWYNEGYIDGKYNRDRQFKEPVSEKWIEELRTKLDSLSKEDFKKVFDKYAIDFNEEPVSEDLQEELHAFVNSEEYVNRIGTSGLLLIARHFADWQKKKVSSIVKQYADKGEKNYQESVMESIGAAYQQDTYWDGFRDCANGIKRELEE
jgi:hypothetical protein